MNYRIARKVMRALSCTDGDMPGCTYTAQQERRAVTRCERRMRYAARFNQLVIQAIKKHGFDAYLKDGHIVVDGESAPVRRGFSTPEAQPIEGMRFDVSSKGHLWLSALEDPGGWARYNPAPTPVCGAG